MKRCDVLIILTISVFALAAFGCAPYPPAYQVASTNQSYMPENAPTPAEPPVVPGMEHMINVHVVGKGIAPETATSKGQAILLAERAAINDGYRKLVERIKGVYIYQYGQMGNEAIDFDFIRIEMETWLRGAEILKIEQKENGIVEAQMRTRIHVNQDHMLYNYAPPQN